MKIGPITILISNCTTGIYLRWWFLGWHYYNFTNGYEITMVTENVDIQTTRLFSIISKIERPTKIKAEYSYQVTLHGITPENIAGFTGLLQAEKVEQYEGSIWYEVEITRGDHLIRENDSPGYIFDFEITRKELPNTPAVFQKVLKLYLNDTLCDMDDDEIVPINKQTNDIAEMQDRQSDFTAQFKVRKTRAMRALFELSGETGVNTVFPFEAQTCRLIQDNIEIITNGQLILDRVDEYYYYVSILSGNKSFFKDIETLKITDLTLASTNHTWNVATMVATHAGTPDYIYPLCEPSDDGGIAPMTDDGDRVEMYGGWIWPFIKLKAIWDEIFTNAGYYDSGDILTNPVFLKMFMPISSVKPTNTDQYLYSMYWSGYLYVPSGSLLGEVDFPGTQLIKGNLAFQLGTYQAAYTATYKIKATTIVLVSAPILTVRVNGVGVGTMTVVNSVLSIGVTTSYEYNVAALIGDDITVYTTANTLWYWSVAITEITNPLIGYGSTITPSIYLPDMLQVDFIKMVCNMFGLIPEVTARDHKIKFWNYSELYTNVPLARDWSAYLSERQDEMEFKFGDYAQSNYLRYKESNDVIQDNGTGIMSVNDTNLPVVKDVVELPVSTCDEVEILTTIISVFTSRIAFNKYDPNSGLYDQNETIDPRVVYIDFAEQVGSPLYQKTFGIRATVGAGAATDVTPPKKASSTPVSFSYLVTNYASLSRLLTRTNLRRAKFNLPVYEVAGLKHYIPIYLSQYKAYFYVNKINNYVPGQLCTVDLIKL